MDILAAFSIAWTSLKANKMRSFLTALGIIIGVGAVIIMVSLSQGATSTITDRISSMGSNLLMVMPGGSRGPVRGTAVAQLTKEDAEAIARLPMVKNVAPEATSQLTVAAGNSTWQATVSGTQPQWQDIRNWKLAKGVFFTAEDTEQVAQVAVLGQTVVDNLYSGGQDPLGTTVRINGIDFTVIGVLEKKGSGGMGGDQDNYVYMPLTTAQQRLMGVNTIRLINVQAVSAEMVPVMKESVTTLMRQRHRLATKAEDDFRIMDMSELLTTVEDTTRIMTFLLGGIAGVSLIVGGIGIMNIMLVSVTERTREIGIRMAVGATTRAILTQFLIEALLLSLIGGLIGVALGWGGTALLGWLAGWSMKVVPWLIGLALGFAMTIGLFFGYYPARKAAHSNPIDALRFE